MKKLKERIVELLTRQVGKTLPIWLAPKAIDVIAEDLLLNGVIALPHPMKIGDKIYHVLLDESVGSWFISEDTVTDVSIKGVWVSGFDPPQDDEGWLIRWEKFGKNDDGAIPCFTREEAERFLEAINHE